jgi:hypothetical protein
VNNEADKKDEFLNASYDYVHQLPYKEDTIEHIMDGFIAGAEYARKKLQDEYTAAKEELEIKLMDKGYKAGYAAREAEKRKDMVAAYMVGKKRARDNSFNKGVEACIKMVVYNMDETIQDNMRIIHEDLQSLKKGL